MPVDQSLIGQWYNEGVAKGATHMIIVCDTFEYEDFPVYVMPHENAREVAKKEAEKPLQRVMEVYSLSMPVDEQYNQGRCFNYD